MSAMSAMDTPDRDEPGELLLATASGDSAAFAETMYNTVKGNQWMCGFPDSTLVSIIGGEYVLVAFRINDAMDPFEAKFQEAYPEAQIAYNEAIA
jgi:hypothetical protein